MFFDNRFYFFFVVFDKLQSCEIICVVFVDVDV